MNFKLSLIVVACTLLVGCKTTSNVVDWDVTPMAGAKIDMPIDQAIAICQREAERQHPASAYVISRPAPSNPSPTSYNTTTNCQGYGNTINCQGTANPNNNSIANDIRRRRAGQFDVFNSHVAANRRSAAKHETVKTCLAAKGLKIEKRVPIDESYKKNQGFLCGGPMPVFSADSSMCN